MPLFGWETTFPFDIETIGSLERRLATKQPPLVLFDGKESDESKGKI